MRHQLYYLIAQETRKSTWNDATIKALEDLLPSGSGIDSGTKISVSSTGNKIILEVPFHHMNSNGYYDGWTDYTIVVIPDFLFGIDVSVRGRDRNGIKEYLAELYSDELCEMIKYSYSHETGFTFQKLSTVIPNSITYDGEEIERN